MSTAEFNTFVNGSLSFLTTPVVSSLLTLSLVSYAGMAAPRPPAFYRRLLNSAPVRVLVLSLVVWSNNKDPTVAVLIALGLILGVNILSGRSPFETFLIEQDTDVYPACQGVTMSDILAVFGGDREKMELELFNNGVPLNVERSDYYAPIIASYLINKGYTITAGCSAPSGNAMGF